jgi:ABC-type thiamin/hydroxymethylpyrimidine transport system permease subunit
MIDCRCALGQRGIATGATLAVALIPKFGCPLCAPLLATMLGMLGLSLHAIGWLLTALAGGFVCIAVFLLMRDRPNCIPAALALAAAVVVLSYRLFNLPESMRYFGSTAFALALIWRAWSRMRRQRFDHASFTTEES